MKKIFFGIISLIIFSSCEDIITLDPELGEIQLSVDAFLTNKDEPQVIYLKNTKQFFDSELQQPYNADSVYVTDNLNNKFVFESVSNDGAYLWDDSVMIFDGRVYRLTIKVGGEYYTSTSTAYPVPEIDSLNWEYLPPQIGEPNGGYAVELVARDLPGQFDYYWIRFLKNGIYDNELGGLNISVDGAISEAAQGDGQLFTPSVSTFLAYNYEDSLGLGDEATYEIWSISSQTFSLWQEVTNQAIFGGGIGALFATPTANVRTNIISPSNPKIKDKAVGWFSTSLVSRKSQVLYDKEGEILSFAPSL